MIRLSIFLLAADFGDTHNPPTLLLCSMLYCWCRSPLWSSIRKAEVTEVHWFELHVTCLVKYHHSVVQYIYYILNEENETKLGLNLWRGSNDDCRM